MRTEVYCRKRTQEQEKIMESTFWADFIKEIEEQKWNAVARCVKNENVNRIHFHQGEVYSIDRILELPQTMLNEWKKGTTSES